MSNYTKKSCPFCKGYTFVNEFGDIQCDSCRKILPFDYDIEPTTEKRTIMSKKGVWIAKEKMIRSPFAANYYCSECKTAAVICSTYCPSCGAEMQREPEKEKVELKFSISDLKQAVICCVQNDDCQGCPLNNRCLDIGCIDTLLLSLSNYLPDDEQGKVNDDSNHNKR